MPKKIIFIAMLLSTLLLLVACNNQGTPPTTEYQLQVTVEGQGTVGPSGGVFKENTMIQFVINPDQGWLFSNWSGQDYQDLIQAGSKWQILMNGHKSLKAVFVKGGGVDDRQLTVQVQGQGNVVPNSGFYQEGTEVTLNVQPQTGWSFSRWAGEHGHEVRQAGNEYSIVMNSDKRLIAIFEEGQSNQYRLVVDIIGKGKVEEKLVSQENADYPMGSRVRLWAKPDTNWLFKEWRGDAHGNEEITFINMDRDMLVTAVFEQKPYHLEVTVIGEGKVEERLLGGEYPCDSVVELTAKPAKGWSFKEWRGDANGKNPKYILEINGDLEVTAVFEVDEVNLEINIVGKGKVEEKLLGEIYEPGALVELKAIPAKNWEFQRWQGDAQGTKPIIEIEVLEDMEITAVFVEKTEFSIKVTITGEGRVEQKLVKGLADSEYPYGSLVKLTAIADSGWRFKEWQGDVSGKSREIEIEVDEDKEVEAIFEEQKEGNGEVSGSVTVSHFWPHPDSGTKSFSKPGKSILRLSILDYAVARLTPQIRDTYVPGEFIIGFAEDSLTLAADEVQELKGLGFEILKELTAIHAYVVEGPVALDKVSNNEAVETIKARLNSGLAATNMRISYVEPNQYVYALSTAKSFKEPNDEHYHHQWHYRQIRLPQAWAVTTGSSSVRVAILDTGINVGHPDLGKNIDVASGWNFNANNSNTTDLDGHGTHCAGTVGGDTDNGTGVAGVNWDVSIIPIKVLGDDGTGKVSDTVEGILYAVGVGSKPLANPAQVLSMSLGGRSPNSAMEQACNRAVQEGAVIFAASGNDGNGSISYPAIYQSVICVGATDYNYPNEPQKASYSNYGSQMDVVAPGGTLDVDSDGNGYNDGVLSTSLDADNPTDFGYWFYTGTSMACPHAAGVGALMIANGVPVSRVRETIRRTAMDIGSPGFDDYFGYGLINAYWAINDVKEIKLLVGTKNGDTIDAVAEGTIDLESNTYKLGKIPEGEYKVFGWIDVQNTGTIDQGDYFFASDSIYFSDNDKQTVNINLQEIK